MANECETRILTNSFNRKSSYFTIYIVVAFIITFVILGLSISVTGPTIIFLEEISYTWEDEVALIFTGRSVGALGGWLFSLAILEENASYAGSLIGFGLFGLTLVNFSIAYSRHLWWLMAAFAVQGGFMVVAAQGCLTYVFLLKNQSARRIQQFLVFCSIIGCALAPILIVPLSCEVKFIGKTNMPISLAATNVSSLHVPVQSLVHRLRRSIDVEDDDGDNAILKFPPLKAKIMHELSAKTLSALTTKLPFGTTKVEAIATTTPHVPTTVFPIKNTKLQEILMTTTPKTTKILPIKATKLKLMSTTAFPVTRQKLTFKNTKLEEFVTTTTPSNMKILPDEDTELELISITALPVTRTEHPFENTALEEIVTTTTPATAKILPVKVTELELKSTRELPVMTNELSTEPSKIQKNSSVQVAATRLPIQTITLEVMKTTTPSFITENSLENTTKLQEVEKSELPLELELTAEIAKLKTNTTALPVIAPTETYETSEVITTSVSIINQSTPVNANSTSQTTFKSEVNITVAPSPAFTDAVAKKPSFVDAKHLNQDSKTADGSNTVAKMKQTEFDENAPPPIHSENHKKSDESKKPSVLDAEHLNQDQKTADGSNTAAIMKQTDGDVHDNDANIPPPVVVRKTPIETPIAVKTSTTSPILSSDDVVVSTQKPDNDAMEQNSSISYVITSVDSKESKPVVDHPIVENEKNIAESDQLAKDDAVKTRSNDSYNLHSSYNSKWNRFAPTPWDHKHPREQYIQSVKHVYLSIGFLTLIAWFILLPMTGFFQHVRSIFECFRSRSTESRAMKIENEDTLLPLKNQVSVTYADIRSSTASNAEIIPTPTDDNMEAQSSQEIPKNHSRSDSSLKSVTWTEQPEENQRTSIWPSLSVPNFSVFRIKHMLLTKSVNSGCTPEPSVYLSYAPEPTVWPVVNWPVDFWVFMSAFLFTGLETTYGAFLHSFTLRTLHWSPVEALWVTTVFWSGNALGRICCLCLGPLTDIGVNMLQPALNLTSKSTDMDQPSESSRNTRRTRVNRIAALVIRTFGSLICVISAAMLKHFTKTFFILQRSTLSASDPSLLDSLSFSKDQATWMGSFGVGLGLGITASSGLSVCNELGQRLHLAGLLGQMILPATSGYITERMLHNNASETLGRTSLILACLLFFSLSVDLILNIFRRFPWWSRFLRLFQCFIDSKAVLQQKRSSRKVESNFVLRDGMRSAEHEGLLTERPSNIAIPPEKFNLKLF